MEVLRADLVASNSPTGFWPYALQHAINILNRTTGPPLDDFLVSSFELLTGSKPKVLSIMPFGCRTFAVKPRSFYSKTEIDARAWTGINLGANSSSPGAYNIWLPTEGKMLNSSDALFDESLFPWRPKGDQRVGPPIAIPAPTDDQTGADLLHSEPEYELPSRSAPTSLADTYAQASRGGANARRSRMVLILFSGAYRRPSAPCSPRSPRGPCRNHATVSSGRLYRSRRGSSRLAAQTQQTFHMGTHRTSPSLLPSLSSPHHHRRP